MVTQITLVYAGKTFSMLCILVKNVVISTRPISPLLPHFPSNDLKEAK
jgi:hypothetical protein